MSAVLGKTSRAQRLSQLQVIVIADAKVVATPPAILLVKVIVIMDATLPAQRLVLDVVRVVVIQHVLQHALDIATMVVKANVKALVQVARVVLQHAHRLVKVHVVITVLVPILHRPVVLVGEVVTVAYRRKLMVVEIVHPRVHLANQDAMFVKMAVLDARVVSIHVMVVQVLYNLMVLQLVPLDMVQHQHYKVQRHPHQEVLYIAVYPVLQQRQLKFYK